ncbi:protein LAZ1, partial [Tanacetum coccineum]
LDFIDAFPGAYAVFQPYRISDHSPSVLKIPSLVSTKPKPFKFYNFLTHKPQFKELLFNTWSIQVYGQNMYKVVSKLKALKTPLRKLLHDQGNLHEWVNLLRVELDTVQRALDANPMDTNLRDEEAIYLNALNEAKLDEERFLKQKAKVEWLEARDSNSSYFHKTVKARNQYCRIEVILDSNNVEVEGALVPEVFINHYEEFLGNHSVCDDLNIDGLFHSKVSDQSCLSMVRDITNNEIKNSMFNIGDDRAPGPDRYKSAFFKKGWDVVGDDVCNAVRDFFLNGKLLKEVNHTFLALIPKVSTPIRVNDYRPISCCNVIYKYVSKIITNRIIKGIKEVIMACVTSASYSIRINGNIHGFFRGKIGLRKGDPLSPYLFTLVMEVLTMILKRRVLDSDSFRYYKHCEEMDIINLCFAYDLFMFARGDVNSARVIMEALDEFKLALGLVLSIPKSTTYFCNVSNNVKIAILQILPFSEGTLPCMYLGAPLISSRLLNKDCKILMEKVKNRIGDWKNKSLSFAGRLQLCKSVLLSMQVYWSPNIISHKDSLWVSWIHRYKLRGRSFWEVPIVADSTWGWRKLLQLREQVNPLFRSVIRDGKYTSAWFDNWCNFSPLANLLTPRDISNGGFNMNSCVSDLVVNRQWMWPQAWM